MPIVFPCPSCQKKLEVPASLAGRTGRCKRCGGPFTIPTPRVLSPAGPEDEPPPSILSEDLDDDLSEHAAPSPIGVGRSRFASPSRRAGRRPGIPLPAGSGRRIALTAAGCLAIVVGMVLADGLTQGLLTDGVAFLARPRAFWVIAATVLILGAGAKGAANLLRLGRGDWEKAEIARTERIAGGLVLALGLLVVGVRYLRGGEAPGLLAASTGGELGHPPDRNPPDPEAGSPEQFARIRKLLTMLSSDDASQRQTGAEALSMNKPGPPGLVEEVRKSLRGVYDSGGKGERVAAMAALGRWGDDTDLPKIESMRNDPDLQVKSRAEFVLERYKSEHPPKP